MPFRRLIIFVEGPTDEDFIKGVLLPRIHGKYDDVYFNRYAGTRPSKRDAFIRSAKSAQWDYIFLTDINDATCITNRKDHVLDRHPSLQRERVMVVVQEIEGWYLAGLNASLASALNLSEVFDPNEATKEDFANLLPSNLRSPRELMTEILKLYALEEGVVRNTSLRYCVERYFDNT